MHDLNVHQPADSKRNTLFAVLAGVITFAVHAPALLTGFVNWDDGLYVLENPFIRQFDAGLFDFAFFSFRASNWHPLTWLSHALDYALWGPRPAGHHLTSVLLHAFNAALVYLLAVRLIGAARRPPAHPGGPGPVSQHAGLLAALLFGLHPLRVESVAWVSERKDVLCGLFVLLSLLSYLRSAAREPVRAAALFGRHAGALAFFVFAMLSKPMAITLPLVLLIIDWHPLGRFARVGIRALLVEKAPFFAISALSAVVTVLAQQAADSVTPVGELPFTWRFLIAAAAPASYLFKMAVPSGLSPFYPLPRIEEGFRAAAPYLMPAVLTLGITAGCLLRPRRRAHMAAVWLSYIVMLAPVSGLLHVGDASLADRYTYLPGIGPAVLAAVGVSLLAGRLAGREQPARGRLLFLAATVFLAGSLAVLTVRQIDIWRNGETLWTRVIDLFPGAARAYNSRGVYYLEQGLFEKAVRDFRTALRVTPGAPAGVYTNLAWAAVQAGLPDEALQAANAALQRDPGNYQARLYRGIIFLEQDRLRESEEEFRAAIRTKPDGREAYQNLGVALEDMHRLDEAEAAYRAALTLDPSYERPRISLGDLYLRTNRLDQAMSEYEIALQFNPASYQAWNGLGEVFAEQGLPDEAARRFEQALRINPGYGPARGNLEALRK